MRALVLTAFLCGLLSCNTLHVSQTKTPANTPSIGVEWSYGSVNNEELQTKLEEAINAEMEKFNSEKHSFTVFKRGLRDKSKDYITIDFERVKQVGTGGKIAGYTVTVAGIATPIILAVTEAPIIFAFYYWPMHNIRSKITLSANLSDERKNNKYVLAETGALFTSNKTQLPKLIKKYTKAFHNTLVDIETQLAQPRAK